MRINTKSHSCQYCNGSTKVYSKDMVAKMFPYTENKNMLVCENYPECAAYVFFREENASTPGIVANRFLRVYRSLTHSIVDILWKTKLIPRTKVYGELSRVLRIEERYCHIRYFGTRECTEAIIFAFDYVSEHFGSIKDYKELNDYQKNILTLIAALDYNKSDFWNGAYDKVVFKPIIVGIMLACNDLNQDLKIESVGYRKSTVLYNGSIYTLDLNNTNTYKNAFESFINGLSKIVK